MSDSLLAADPITLFPDRNGNPGEDSRGARTYLRSDRNELSASELIHLASRAQAFPSSEQERRRAVEVILAALASKKVRIRLAAVRAFAALETVNIRAAAVAVAAARPAASSTTVNVVGVANVGAAAQLTAEELAMLSELRERRRREAEVAQNDTQSMVSSAALTTNDAAER